MYIMSKKTSEVIEVVFDEYPESPLAWDRLGTLRLFGGYSDDAEDYQKNQTSFEALNELIGDVDSLELANKLGLYEFWKEIQKLGQENGYYIQPVTRYEHGLVNYYLGAERTWDSAVNGFIYARYDKISSWFQKDPGILPSFEKVDQVFSDELNDYTNWANGTVYELDYYQTPDNLVDTDDYIGSIYNDRYTTFESSCNGEIIKEIVNDANDYFGLTDTDYKNWKVAKVHTQKTAYIPA